ncbi:callose synthase 10-like [Carica papaya]|uniref:callose synthase 10-like n=1 Tax=Carica papaya TaxID=3649 RepID=UPI000B8CEFBE|nr:callose synthase 10-like [Carica papaya]
MPNGRSFTKRGWWRPVNSIPTRGETSGQNLGQHKGRAGENEGAIVEKQKEEEVSGVEKGELLQCWETDDRFEEVDHVSSYASMDKEMGTKGDEGLLAREDGRKLALMIVDDEILPLDSKGDVRERAFSCDDEVRGVEEDTASSTWMLQNAQKLSRAMGVSFEGLEDQMAKELDAILDHGEANRAGSCVTENGSVSFLEQIICPIYDTMSAEAARNNNGKAAHSAWRNYDDFNEYFWSPACFELNWPMRRDSRFLLKPKKWRRTGKSSFVEHRTFLHLFRSFHRLWIFMALMFQALTIIAFRHGQIDLDTFKILLSIGPTFGIMNFVESCLDVLLMFGAYTTARGMAISRLVIKFFWCGLTAVAVTYVYVKLLEERNQTNSNSLYFRIYILVLGVYAALRVIFTLLLQFPACHTLSEMSDQSFFQFFKWIYQERYYVGRGLFERLSDYCRYVAFWLVIFVCKFTFAYFLQIRPLVKPTNIIVGLRDVKYSWHDLISKSKYVLFNEIRVSLFRLL